MRCGCDRPRRRFCGSGIDVAAGAGEVFEEFCFNFNVDPWLAVFGAEHQVQDYVG
jgi:hypothetical protein